MGPAIGVRIEFNLKKSVTAMTINDLQAFVMVYDLRHISNAAVELHLSQSELSKRMRALNLYRYLIRWAPPSVLE